MIRLVCSVSLVICVASTILFFVSFAINPWDHRVSVVDDFHIGLWRGQIVFFNDAEYGPYRGSIIKIVDEDGSSHPPMEQETYWGETWGVYYRYFRWAGYTLWTFMVSLLWPVAIFGAPPAIWFCISRRSELKRQA
jgi:hypothetical protein